MKTTPASPTQDLFELKNKFTTQQFQNGWLLSVATEKQGTEFWNLQRDLAINDRTAVYPLLLLDAIHNKGKFNEADFINWELHKYYNVLDMPFDELTANTRARHNILSYITFLEQRKMRLDEKFLNQTLEKSCKLPSVLPRKELIAYLLFVLKDSGVLSQEITDYRFSQWIESNFLFEKTHELKFAKQDISKIRQLEVDATKLAHDIKVRVETTEFRVNDGFE